MKDNLRQKFDSIESLTGEIIQETNSDRLFNDIDKIGDEIDSGIEQRKQEILSLPLEEKKKQALTSSDPFVINLLSTVSNPDVKKKIAQNLNVPTGIMRRFLTEGREMFVPLLINPNLPVEFLDKIANEKISDDMSFVNSLIAFHPNCNDVLREKYEFLKDEDGLTGDIHSFLTEFDNLPNWIAKTFLVEDMRINTLLDHIGSFADCNYIVSEIIKLWDGKKRNKLLKKLEGIENLNLSNEVAKSLSDGNTSDWVLKNSEKFPDLTFDQTVATKLFKKDGFEVLSDHIAKFTFDDPRGFIIEAIGFFPKNSNKLRTIFSAIFEIESFRKFLFEKEILEPYLTLFDGYNNSDVADVLKKAKKSSLDEYIAYSLINHKDYEYVIENIDKFINIDQRKVFFAILNKWDREMAWWDLKKLVQTSGRLANLVLDKEVALKLSSLRDGDGVDVLADCLEKFKGLDEEVALKIIETADSTNRKESVINNLNVFSGLTGKTAIALVSLGKKVATKVIDNLEKFSSIDNEVFMALIKAGVGEAIIKNINKFTIIDRADAGAMLLESGNLALNELISSRDFPKMDLSKVLHGALNSFPPLGASIIDNLDKFKEFGYDYLAEELIKAGCGADVARNLEKFIGVDDKKIASLLINVGQKLYVKKNSLKFSGLSGKNSGQRYEIASNIEKFKGVENHTQLIVDLIMEGALYSMDTSDWFYDLDRFKDLDFKKISFALLRHDGVEIDEDKASEGKIIDALVKSEHGNFVLNNRSHFKIADYNKLIMNIIQNEENHNGAQLVESFLSFSEKIDFRLNKEVALALIPKMQNVKQNFPKIAKFFDDLDKEVAFALMDNGGEKFVLENVKLFKGLSQVMVEKHIEKQKDKSSK